MRLAFIVVGILPQKQYLGFLVRRQFESIKDVVLWRKYLMFRAFFIDELTQFLEIGLLQLVGESCFPIRWELHAHEWKPPVSICRENSPARSLLGGWVDNYPTTNKLRAGIW